MNNEDIVLVVRDANGERHGFRATGAIIEQKGYLRVYNNEYTVADFAPSMWTWYKWEELVKGNNG